MKCPNKDCGIEIPDAKILAEAAAINGRVGGKASGKSKARDPEKMRAAQRKSVIARMRNKQSPNPPAKKKKGNL